MPSSSRHKRNHGAPMSPQSPQAPMPKGKGGKGGRGVQPAPSTPEPAIEVPRNESVLNVDAGVQLIHPANSSAQAQVQDAGADLPALSPVLAQDACINPANVAEV